MRREGETGAVGMLAVGVERVGVGEQGWRRMGKEERRARFASCDGAGRLCGAEWEGVGKSAARDGRADVSGVDRKN